MTTVGDLDAAAAVSAADIIATRQGSDTVDKKVTAAQLKTFIGGVLGQGYTEIASGSTTSTIPLDDTIPQDDEGGLAGTLVYTPKSATSKLLIWYGGQITNTSSVHVAFTLFTGASANAISATYQSNEGTLQPFSLEMFHQIDSPGVSEITFSLRFGSTTGTTVIGSAISHLGAVARAYIKIMEVEV